MFKLDLTPDIQAELFDDLNYLNMEEIQHFCRQHKIPYSIYIENPDGSQTKTSDLDRKGIILDRVRSYLKTAKIQKATVFAKEVVNFSPLPNFLKPTDLVFYGQYKNGKENILHLMKQLTQGAFKFGSIAQEVIRSCWMQGFAPTYEKFAMLWMEASLENPAHPEWAFLADRKKGAAGEDWKQVRSDKARKVLKLLNQIQVK